MLRRLRRRLRRRQKLRLLVLVWLKNRLNLVLGGQRLLRMLVNRPQLLRRPHGRRRLLRNGRLQRLRKQRLPVLVLKLIL
jgi:hypothetical protein